MVIITMALTIHARLVQQDALTALRLRLVYYVRMGTQIPRLPLPELVALLVYPVLEDVKPVRAIRINVRVALININ